MSDGSYFTKQRTGTAAWLIDINNEKIITKGHHQCPGSAKDQSAYRSELFGILGGMTQLMSKINFNQNLTGQVKIYCDGKGAIEAISNNYSIAKTSRKHYDLIQAIWTIINNTKI